MDKVTSYWMEHSSYDLVTAEAMYKSRRYLYVAFMCQQAIEKILKAIISDCTAKPAPRSHDLVRLADEAGLFGSLTDDQVEFMATLTPFCIETRYAEERERLARLTDKALAADMLKKTKEMHRCLKDKLK